MNAILMIVSGTLTIVALNIGMAKKLLIKKILTSIFNLEDERDRDVIFILRVLFFSRKISSKLYEKIEIKPNLC